MNPGKISKPIRQLAWPDAFRFCRYWGHQKKTTYLRC